MIIDLHVPTTVVFGAGRFAELGGHAARYGGRVLLVCGRSAARQYGLLLAATAELERAGLVVTVSDNISAEPLASEVDAAVEAAARARCDVVVALGGGSAIDAGKAVAVGLRAGAVGPLVGTTLAATGGAVPVIAVPTIAGSGAEVTKGAIITDDARSLKSGIRGEDLFPRVAIIDPDLTSTVPAAVAVASGFDALTHAVEGYVARKANPITRSLAEQALEVLGRCLPRLAAGANDPALREELALASLLGGINVANASTCLPHRLQQAMGSVPRVAISHGRGLAAVYPAWLRRAEPHAGDAFATVGRVLGAGDAVTAVGRLLRSTGVGASLRSHGFRATDVGTLVGGVTGNTGNDPIPGIDDDLIRSLFEESL
ncbi:iron-containing alcohol dehydrogenase [Lentzea sp. BCCO 10_0798]|uniref:Iron-containing alcohol dehydrogenase n=1 Tax=Lentzea kristufekii TaxID=3095430 RepID=A0ABU4TRQ2_9PSEU|nr:iron-containing alcohol dehydrogenase [Lentzea sp. BCCO 10_0798]MDX8050895.1 iron-containing alcohol dehydrogenase [Lentzea sp. BCCO 10_0798]